MTAAPSRDVMLFGTEEPPAETRVLTAGPLSVELDGGNLRYVRYGGREAIRAISYVVRDQYWGTYSAAIRDFSVDERADGFTVSYTASCEGDGQRFTYQATIEGTRNGDLVFSATGAGDTDFLTNRTGFVVLHGVEGIAGEPVRVEHVDGRTVETAFPAQIDPKQPIMDIRALTHTVAPGLRVRCEMTGDTFEMEDQRNWTDASYKTYVRPLGLPHPYTLPAGEAFEQSVRLSFEGTAPAQASGRTPVTLSVAQVRGTLPEIGMWFEPRHAEAALSRADVLRALGPAFLSCFVDARTSDLVSEMAGIARVADIISRPLALEVVIAGADPASELAIVAAAARQAQIEFAEVAPSLGSDLGFVIPGTVFPDTAEFDAMFGAARRAFPNARIGGGNFVYFTELNRKPVPTGGLDYMLHGTSALVHAADDRSVTETIECLPSVFGSARAQYPDMHYRVSPAGIGSRTSPFGNDPTPNPDAERVTMTRADPRQRGLLGAAWHLGYAARAAAAGVDSLVLGAPVGEFGLCHAPMPFAQPGYDEAGGLFPAYHVMRALYGASRADCLAVETSSPRDVQAICTDIEDGRELWVANLSGDEQHLRIDGFSPESMQVLDETTFLAGMRDPDLLMAEGTAATAEALLAPYGVARFRA